MGLDNNVKCPGVAKRTCKQYGRGAHLSSIKRRDWHQRYEYSCAGAQRIPKYPCSSPAKLLMNISPIQSVMTGQAEKQRVCVKQLAKIFNSNQSINELTDKALKKEMRQKEVEDRIRKRAFSKEIKQKQIEEIERDRALKREIKENQAKEKGNKEKKKRRKLSYQHDESECDEAISLNDDSTDEWVEEVEEVKEDEPKELQEGTFVVVRVSEKMAYRLFVAKIICKSSEGLEVKFYKRVEKLKFKETDETNYADE